MTELLTAAQMRAIEQAAINTGAVTGLELMERAGCGVVEAILDWRPELAQAPHRAVVLCGPGNNGGDGFVVARLLKQRGWEVEVFLYGDEAKLPPDAAENCRRWRKMGEVAGLTDDAIDGYAQDNPNTDIAIDAIFGTGLSRPFLSLPRVQMELNSWQALSMVGDSPSVVAIDVPSGVCADSGRYLGYENENPFDSAVVANLTVTFHTQKAGHQLADGAGGCGQLVLKDIGLPRRDFWQEYRSLASRHGQPIPKEAPGLIVKEASRAVTTTANMRILLTKSEPQHKYTHGHALILSGPPGKGGAARLAARGALRIGAGLVTIACPPGALQENAARLDAIMLQPVRDADGLTALLADERLNALCLGPGLGLTEHTRALVLAALATPRACVLDADALTVFQDDPKTLFAALHETCVLTPHGGEFKRLFPDIAAKLAEPATKGPAYSKVDATREAAARASCTVLFKGPDTVIADETGRAAINSAHYERTAPWLATAGSGDVLAGFITGLLARGFAPRPAAETAAWLHVDCALTFGPGLIAEDLPEQLPRVFQKLGL